MDGRYLLINSKAEKLYGVTKAEIRGKTTHEIFPDKQANDFGAHDRAVLDTGETLEQEEHWELDDGAHIYLTVKFPIRDKDGEITAIGAIGTDITERKAGEEAVLAAMQEAEIANRAKSEFLANMSHELRTPLNAIIGFSDIIKDERLGPVGSTKYRDYAADINESGQHLLCLINNILDLSKVESGADELYEENTDISETVRSIMRLLTETAQIGNVDLVSEVPDGTPAPRLIEAAYRRLIELLAGIPSVVFGLWGLTVLVPVITRIEPPGASLLAASLVLALMILPTIELISSSALASVPNHHYLGARALGLSKEQAIWKVVMPSALSGVCAGTILGVARAAGETMAVMMVAGNVVQIPDSLFQPVRTLSANIALEVAYAVDLHRASLFASGLIMIVMTLLAFCCAEFIAHSRKPYDVDRT